MDNLCHTLVGGVLARAGCDRLSPLATPTMLVAANLPDVDIMSGFWGDLAYLEYHRGITHSVVGLTLEAPLLAAFVVLIDRIVRRFSKSPGPPARFGGLLVVAVVGLASHVVLDWTNSYGVRPWLPFDGSWYYGDLVFVVDPWLWLLFAAALFIGAARTSRVTLAWIGLFAVMTAAVLFQQRVDRFDASGMSVAIVWLVLVAGVFVARWRVRVLDPTRVAVAALAALLCYWGTMAILHGRAIAVARSSAAMPTLMRPDRWRVVEESQSSLGIGDVLLATRSAPDLREIPRRLDEPSVRSAMQSCPGEVASDFNRFMFADVSESAGRTTVLLKDARFAGVADRYGFGTTEVTLDADLRWVPDGRSCPRSR